MRIKKLFITLNIIIAAAVLFSFIYYLAVGSDYTFYTNTYSPDAVMTDASANFEHNGVVEMTDAHYVEDGELVLRFHALKPGNTKVNVTVNKTYDGVPTEPDQFPCELTVTNLGKILDVTYYTVNFEGYPVVLYSVMFILLAMLIFLLIAFSEYWKAGDFNYRMVACIGIGMFVGVLLLFIVYKWLNQGMRYFSSLLGIFFDIGDEVFLLIAPPMLVISVLLAVSNIWLLRHEGYRPVNALGIVFGFLWFIAISICSGISIIPETQLDARFDMATRCILYISCYFGTMFIGTVICAYLATKYRPPYDRDYIIILGCGIRGDGTLTPLLKGRVDAALEFEKEQFEETGRHAIFVPSGGQGSDEVISESRAMTNYLREQGIPEEQILMEDKSVNTMQNMQFSRKVIEAHAEDFSAAKIAFATTNYHIFRGYILAKKNGFDAKGISAKTKFYFYPNAFLREYIGLLVDQKFKHILFLALTLIVFVLTQYFHIN